MNEFKSFLIVGSDSPHDILSLTKQGYEVSDCEFSFEQGTDERGKAQTKVYGGLIHLTLTSLPLTDIIEWMLVPRKYHEGCIVIVDSENTPTETIYFEDATCINMAIDYTCTGEAYSSTQLTLQTKRIICGNGVTFKNDWTIF